MFYPRLTFSLSALQYKQRARENSVGHNYRNITTDNGKSYENIRIGNMKNKREN